MNLFFTRLFGKMMSAETFEKSIRTLQADAKRYRAIEASEVCKEYVELKKLVESNAFLTKKQELTGRKYKDTDCYKKQAQLKALLKDKTVKQYLKAADAEARAKVEGAMAVKEYLALKAEVETPAFKQQDAFWADKNRWVSTEEGKKEARYQALSASEDIRFYLKADVKKIEELESWKEAFAATFAEGSLAKNGLAAGFWMKQKGLKTDFSYKQQAQAYLGEKNVSVAGNVLSIVTKKEAVQAPAWDEKKGFVMHEFQLSSAVVNTGDSFKQTEGVFAAKVRATGKCHSAIYLMGEKGMPLVELMHYNGSKLAVGTADKNGRSEEVLSGVPAGNWNVVAAIVSLQEIVWMVNGYEVLRTKNPLPGQALYLSAQSFAPAGKKAGEGRMDIAWMRAMKH